MIHNTDLLTSCIRKGIFLEADDGLALTNAAVGNQPEIIKTLISNGFNIHAYGSIALEWAKTFNSKSAIKALVDCGIDSKELDLTLKAKL